MQLKIRSKFIGILLIAAVLPLCLALVAIVVLGYHHYKRERGRLFQETATFIAVTVEHNLNKEIDKLSDWMALAHLAERSEPFNALVSKLTEAALTRQVEEWEERWPTLKPQSPELAELLTNDLSRALREFQSVNPLFAEIMMTDVRGRLIAATNKTTDYWQADEDWWKYGIQVQPKHCYLEGIHFDDSADVYSLDICIPVFAGGRAVGVLKAVLNTSPLIASVPLSLSNEHAAREIVEADGHIMFELYSRMGSHLGERIDEAAVPAIVRERPGWTFVRLKDKIMQLAGFAPLKLGGPRVDRAVPTGVRPLFVLVHDDAATMLAPVRRQLWVLVASGAVLILIFTWAGYYIATRKIIGPIETLREAARILAESAKQSADGQSPSASPVTGLAGRVLEQLQQVDTRDEIEDLAREFGAMSRRVLSYHEQLEGEIAAKTASIQEDLQFAREFQEALMPRQYPQVTNNNPTHPLCLNFHHIYKPTSSVGGDFFDVLKLSDKRAGIFIADVMGHGARSALVTAILRTLLQDLASQGNDPAKFLSLINQHFIDITGQGNQFVFVSAFYLIVDTERALVTYASAGHPSPYRADREHRKVTPLIERLENNPALGLFPNSTYTNFTSFIKEDDAFLLFTDGVFEAGNGDGEQFGRDRLRQVIEQNLDLDVSGICQRIVESLNEFTATANLPDDICIVGVDVTRAAKLSPA